ncbi:hypothetical protein AGMMS50262_00410 [Bacteroidia bacterium]|nr:hypothetical protein AGMMS50262_00410 [Bacteroidia bacterium]
MIYKDSFIKLVEEYNVDNYIGTGNPNAKILIVGKEGSCIPEKRRDGEVCFTQEWDKKIKNDEDINFKYKKDGLKEGHTWNKYQKLHDYIFPEYKKDGFFNFEERFFTTEMSAIRKKTTEEAQKDPKFEEKLKKRKESFFKSEFIQQFPVVILACSNYIKNNDKVREIDNLFDVKFVEAFTCERKSKKYSFWTHDNADKTKLVIHTRQLSSDVPEELLEKMGKVINKFAENNNIILL